MRIGSGIPRTAHCSHCFASRSLRPDLQHNEDTSFTRQSAQAKSATHDGTKCSEMLGPTDHRTRPSPTLMRDTYEKACHNTITERHTSRPRNETRVVGSATVQQTSPSKRWCVVGTRPGRMSTEQSSDTAPVMVVEKTHFCLALCTRHDQSGSSHGSDPNKDKQTLTRYLSEGRKTMCALPRYTNTLSVVNTSREQKLHILSREREGKTRSG